MIEPVSFLLGTALLGFFVVASQRNEARKERDALKEIMLSDVEEKDGGEQ